MICDTERKGKREGGWHFRFPTVCHSKRASMLEMWEKLSILNGTRLGQSGIILG